MITAGLLCFFIIKLFLPQPTHFTFDSPAEGERECCLISPGLKPQEDSKGTSEAGSDERSLFLNPVRKLMG